MVYVNTTEFLKGACITFSNNALQQGLRISYHEMCITDTYLTQHEVQVKDFQILNTIVHVKTPPSYGSAAGLAD